MLFFCVALVKEAIGRPDAWPDCETNLLHPISPTYNSFYQYTYAPKDAWNASSGSDCDDTSAYVSRTSYSEFIQWNLSTRHFINSVNLKTRSDCIGTQVCQNNAVGIRLLIEEQCNGLSRVSPKGRITQYRVGTFLLGLAAH